MSGDPRPLTPEEASTLAKRWAHARSVAAITRAARRNLGLAMRLALTGADAVLRIEPLTDGETERLFAWVRKHHLHILAMGLGITADQAMDLCRAAGCGPGTPIWETPP